MNQKIFRDLLRALAYIYPDPQSIYRVSADAGIDLQRIDFNTNMSKLWHSVLVEAENTGRIDDLLRVVEDEYGSNWEFQRVTDAYRRSTGVTDRPELDSTEEKRRLAEEIQARRLEADIRTLEEAKTVDTIRNIYHTFAASELIDPVSTLLRRFSRISQDVDTALRQESNYNQRQVLTSVQDRLDSLLMEISRTSERAAFRFRPIAAQWRLVINTYIRELAKAAELRQEIDSPYITGVPLTNQQVIFVGRTDLSARVEQLLADRRRPPLLLYGQRRMGKTSLLLNLGRMLRTTIVPLFVDLQGSPSQANDHTGLLYNLARAMIDSASEQRQMPLPLLSRDELVQDPFTRFNEWLDEVEKILGQNTALLLLDEFEALDHAFDENRFDPVRVLGMLRHLIQHRPRFKVLLAGSHTLDELQRWSSYLINVQVVKVGYLKEAEARQLVEQPVEDFTLRYEPAASQRVLDLTRGHPFLVQLLCEEIVALKNEQEPAQRRLARLTDVEAAVPEALNHGRLFFSDIQQNQIDKVGVGLLIYLAVQGAGAVLSRKALEKQAPPQNGFGHALDLLLQRDLIEPIGNGYRFQVELIRRWFAQQASAEMQATAKPSLLKRITQGLFERSS
ncbi:MAG: effector-associated domain EAD1-containing protein [Caldilineaceae bacterium]